MTETEIKIEVKKAVDLLNDTTWNLEDFTARMLQIIREEKNAGFFESYLANVMEMRRLQGQYWKGDKKVLPECRGAEGRIDRLNIQAMKLLGITNPEAFAKKFKQSTILFNQ